MLSLPCPVLSLMMLIFSSQVSIATVNCNHAAVDGYIVVADVCFADGTDSHMLQCRDGEGVYKLFTSNDDCDENHVNVFDMSLDNVTDAEVVCDAEPCHIAVFEVYDDGSDSSDSSEITCYDHCATCDGSGWEDCATCDDGYEMTGDDDQDGYGYCTMVAMRRLQDSCSSHDQCSSEMSFCYSGSCSSCDECHFCDDGVDGTCGTCGNGYPTQESSNCNDDDEEDTDTSSSSDSRSSSDSSSCDYDGTPTISPIIIDACMAAGDSESMIITCTGTHDAMVAYFMDDEDHECSGTATMTMPASALFADGCGLLVACNVEAGADYDDAALSATVFAPLLIAFAVLINA